MFKFTIRSYRINTSCTSNATSNSCISTAISQQLRYYTLARFPIGSIGVSPIRSHPYGPVLQAFSSQLTVRPPCGIHQPILTSTPIALKAASNHLTNSSETLKTVLSETVERSYNHLCDFRRDRLEDNWMPQIKIKLYHWINKQKKNMLRGIRAR